MIDQVMSAIERFDTRLGNCTLTRSQHGHLMQAVQVLRGEVGKILMENLPVEEEPNRTNAPTTMDTCNHD